MKTLQIFAALILLALVELAHAGTKSKCDVVRALRNENVPDSEMRDCKQEVDIDSIEKKGFEIYDLLFAIVFITRNECKVA